MVKESLTPSTFSLLLTFYSSLVDANPSPFLSSVCYRLAIYMLQKGQLADGIYFSISGLFYCLRFGIVGHSLFDSFCLFTWIFSVFHSVHDTLNFLTGLFSTTSNNFQNSNRFTAHVKSSRFASFNVSSMASSGLTWFYTHFSQSQYYSIKDFNYFDVFSDFADYPDLVTFSSNIISELRHLKTVHHRHLLSVHVCKVCETFEPNVKLSESYSSNYSKFLTILGDLSSNNHSLTDETQIIKIFELLLDVVNYNMKYTSSLMPSIISHRSKLVDTNIQNIVKHLKLFPPKKLLLAYSDPPLSIFHQLSCLSWSRLVRITVLLSDSLLHCNPSALQWSRLQKSFQVLSHTYSLRPPCVHPLSEDVASLWSEISRYPTEMVALFAEDVTAEFRQELMDGQIDTAQFNLEDSSSNELDSDSSLSEGSIALLRVSRSTADLHTGVAYEITKNDSSTASKSADLFSYPLVFHCFAFLAWHYYNEQFISHAKGILIESIDLMVSAGLTDNSVLTESWRLLFTISKSSENPYELLFLSLFSCLTVRR
ncbi:hypothetical protein GEMRC1_003001 [Eukaryota sp. GEM-RC1]